MVASHCGNCFGITGAALSSGKSELGTLSPMRQKNLHLGSLALPCSQDVTASFGVPVPRGQGDSSHMSVMLRFQATKSQPSHVTKHRYMKW